VSIFAHEADVFKQGLHEETRWRRCFSTGRQAEEVGGADVGVRSFISVLIEGEVKGHPLACRAPRVVGVLLSYIKTRVKLSRVNGLPKMLVSSDAPYLYLSYWV